MKKLSSLVVFCVVTTGMPINIFGADSKSTPTMGFGEKIGSCIGGTIGLVVDTTFNAGKNIVCNNKKAILAILVILTANYFAGESGIQLKDITAFAQKNNIPLDQYYKVLIEGKRAHGAVESMLSWGHWAWTSARGLVSAQARKAPEDLAKVCKAFSSVWRVYNSADDRVAINICALYGQAPLSGIGAAIFRAENPGEWVN